MSSARPGGELILKPEDESLKVCVCVCVFYYSFSAQVSRAGVADVFCAGTESNQFLLRGHQGLFHNDSALLWVQERSRDNK